MFEHLLQVSGSINETWPVKIKFFFGIVIVTRLVVVNRESTLKSPYHRVSARDGYSLLIVGFERCSL